MANFIINSPSLLNDNYSYNEEHNETKSNCSDSSVNFKKNVMSDDYNKPSTSKQQSDINHCVNEKTKKKKEHGTPYVSKMNNVDEICLSSDDSDIIVCDDLNSSTIMTDVSNLNRSDDSTVITVMNVKSLHHILDENIGLKVLFKNHFMEPLTFLLLLHDYSLELKLSKLIEDFGGVVYNSVTDADDFTIVLVKDDSIHWAYTGPVFKVSYIPACIDAKKIVNITPFFKSSFKKQYINNFDFMTVVYFKKYTWDEIPMKYISSKSSPNKILNKSPVPESVACHKKFNNEPLIISDDESSKEELDRSNIKKCKTINKHSRMFYSIKEDEDILKYIVFKKGFSRLKGNIFWKTMEDKNICPHRTWQSMKEHFIKKIVYRLDNFTFLTNKQKELLQLSGLR